MSSYLCPYYPCNNAGHFYFLLRLLKLSPYGSSCFHFFLISYPFSIPQIPSIKNHLFFSGSSLPQNEKLKILNVAYEPFTLLISLASLLTTCLFYSILNLFLFPKLCASHFQS